MPQCPSCRRENPPDRVFCVYCEKPMDPHQNTPRVSVRDLYANHPRWGSARLTERHRLRLQVVGTSASIEIDLRADRPLILGRRDPGSDLAPDVDLGAYGGTELGVSRQHARLAVSAGALLITDLGSTNGTYLNGLPLPVGQAHILRDSDAVHLGGLRLRVALCGAAAHTSSATP